MIVGPPYPRIECIKRLQDNPLASDEKSRCHRPDANVILVLHRANKSNEDVQGVGKKELVGDVNFVFLGCSMVRDGIQRGVTPGGKSGSFPSLVGVKKSKRTKRKVGKADIMGTVVSAHSRNSSSETVVVSSVFGAAAVAV
mmetsp:Transcript_40433/g.84907  ORF Transcript_40433/g.84907 Transcript_40433/m.84907 type:complete len:141 (+) Transcript_40433:349-771(+)